MSKFFRKHILSSTVAFMFSVATIAGLCIPATPVFAEEITTKGAPQVTGRYTSTICTCPMRTDFYGGQDTTKIVTYVPRNATVEIFSSAVNSYGHVWYYCEYTGTSYRGWIWEDNLYAGGWN